MISISSSSDLQSDAMKCLNFVSASCCASPYSAISDLWQPQVYQANRYEFKKDNLRMNGNAC
ncbi:hypothetical protein MSL71_30640 [Desulfoluna butyratoxydans]|uniref:Uncharacterized protein n=1 Tax=Desulfoluna butyratoxydans TaxID=231438 RepID=A0A4U8YPN7_9BACT|nr:hypothetical protein MSL71_30640 [Desulfoluna butyratoxydans]